MVINIRQSNRKQDRKARQESKTGKQDRKERQERKTG